MDSTAVVIGSGVGGLCVAARLAAAGWEVTVVERLRRLGGRWSTIDIEGFKLPTGAFLIATDDALAHTFDELGIEFEVHPLPERTVYLVDGELVETGRRGGLRALIGAAARHDGSDTDSILTRIRSALAGEERVGDGSIAEWLAAAGAGSSVAAAVHSLNQAFMGVNAAEVPAEAFFDYLRATAGRGRHGIPPRGSRQLADALAGYVTARGGVVVVGTAAVGLMARNAKITGVELRDGTALSTEVVVSDVGVAETAKLLPPELHEMLPEAASIRPAPGITSFVASREPFFDHPAVVVSGTRCVCLVTTPTLVAPELAPPGWHYTETISTFASSADDSDPKSELQRHRADMDDLLHHWRDEGRLLHTATYRGAWPVYRAWPGEDASDRFPIPGLALVGDAVKPKGWPGTGASAESARIVAEGISAGLHAHPGR